MTPEKSNLKTPKRISDGYLNAMGCPFIEVGKIRIEIGEKIGRFCLYLCNIGSTTPPGEC